MGNSDFYLNFFAIVALLLIVIIPIQWVTNFYFGLIGGVLSSIALSVLGGLLYQFVHQFGRAMASTGNVHVSKSELLYVFGGAFLIALAITALSNFGVYHLVQYYKSGILNKLAFFSWLLITAGGPLGYIGAKEFSAWRVTYNKERHFTPVFLSVYTYPELPIIIDELRFVNTSNGKESTIYFYQYDRSEWEGKEINDRSLWEAFSKKIDIPKGADSFVMSWYSLVEDIYYSDEFPFPYDRFPMRKYPAGSNEMEPLKIHIKPEGKVDLLGSYQKLLFYYKDIATKPINDNEKNEKLMTFMSRHMSKGRKEELAAALEAINASGRPQKRMEMEEKAFHWRMTLEGLGEVSTIHLGDFRYQNYRPTDEWLGTMSKKPLPAVVSVYFKTNDQEKGFWVTFYPDFEQLYQIVLDLTAGNDDQPISFSLAVKDHLKEEIEFLIKSDTETVKLTAWQVKID